MYGTRVLFKRSLDNHFQQASLTRLNFMSRTMHRFFASTDEPLPVVELTILPNASCRLCSRLGDSSFSPTTP